MHKLIEYICDELKDLEKKADKNGKLTMQEIQYMDTLAHAKKNLLKAEEMSEEMEGYSSRGYSGRRGMSRMSYDDGGSYRSGSYRGRSYDGGGSYADERMDFVRPDGSYRENRAAGESYSRAAEDMRKEIHKLMEYAPDEQTRRELRNIMDRM